MRIHLRFAPSLNDNESKMEMSVDGRDFAEVSNKTGERFEIKLYAGMGISCVLGDLLEAIEQAVLDLGGNPTQLRDSIRLRFAARIVWTGASVGTFPMRRQARFSGLDQMPSKTDTWNVTFMLFDHRPLAATPEATTEVWVYYDVVEAGRHCVEPGTLFEVLNDGEVVGRGEVF